MKIYMMEYEIYEGNCPRYKVGEKFSSIQDLGKKCDWLAESATTMSKILEYDGTLPWDYKGTKYEKIINKDGVTTEFVRCPDPTSAGVVLKITRTQLTEEQIQELIKKKKEQKT